MAAKTKIFAGVIAVVLAPFFFTQHRSMTRLRSENENLLQQLALMPDANFSTPTNSPGTNDVARLRAQGAEVIRLRGEVTLLRRERDELLRRVATASTNVTRAPVAREGVDTRWVQEVISRPPAEQGLAAGTLRGKLLRGEMTNVSPSELALRDALVQQRPQRHVGAFTVWVCRFSNHFHPGGTWNFRHDTKRTNPHVDSANVRRSGRGRPRHSIETLRRNGVVGAKKTSV